MINDLLATSLPGVFDCKFHALKAKHVSSCNYLMIFVVEALGLINKNSFLSLTISKFLPAGRILHHIDHKCKLRLPLLASLLYIG